MSRSLTISTAAAAISLLALSSAARAQEMWPGEYNEPMRNGFVEANGSYGLQIGETDYLPDGSFENFKFPWVYGWGAGGTIGIPLGTGIALIGNYEYTSAVSVKGKVPMFLDKVKGRIKYHSAAIGLRIWRPVGFGRLTVEFAGGIAFPHQTRVNVTYGPALALLTEPITGKGRMIEKFNWGFGGHGQVGYELPVTRHSYIGLNIRLKVFQSNNHEKLTKLRNFVVDFNTDQPVAVTADIKHGDHEAQPRTVGVQDARAQLTLGVRF